MATPAFNSTYWIRLGFAFGGGTFLGTIIERGGIKKPALDLEKATKSIITPHSSIKFGFPQPLVSTESPLCYTNHSLAFDPQKKTPVWVAEHISRDKVEPKEEKANRKNSKFLPDTQLPEVVRPENKDFWNSGWSRGHMAPAGNNKHSQKAMDDTFLLSNIVPQDIDNNGDFWNRLEIYCRDLTKKYSDIWVISGPLWLPKERDFEKQKLEQSGDYNEGEKHKKGKRRYVSYEVIGKNSVAVPTHLYKIILAESSGKPLMASFIVPNKPIRKEKVSMEDVEKSLGLKFHPKMDRDEIQDLCQVEGCQMMDYRKFQHYYITRGIRGARNQRDLDRYWRRAQKLELVSPEITSLFEERQKEFSGNKEEEPKKI